MSDAVPSSTDKLRVEIEGGVARVLIDNSERRNAFDFSMWRALPAIMRRLDELSDVRVVVLTGAPSLPFCSGADISEFSTVRATAQGGRDYEQSNVEAFDALSQISKPVIAAIAGFCMGGGMGLCSRLRSAHRRRGRSLRHPRRTAWRRLSAVRDEIYRRGGRSAECDGPLFHRMPH